MARKQRQIVKRKVVKKKVVNKEKTSQPNASDNRTLNEPTNDANKPGEEIMGRALIIGIDDYDNYAPLGGCAADAEAMLGVLESHADGSPNFDCRIATSKTTRITQRFLRNQWFDLFSNYDGDIVFYFAGHGVPTPAGAVLVTQDGADGDSGLPMDELLTLANHAHKARSVLLILDCCHSGTLGTPALFSPTPGAPDVALLASGVSCTKAKPKMSSMPNIKRTICSHD